MQSEAKTRPLDLSNLLRHAFISGFQAMGGTITAACGHWPQYDPETCSAYNRVSAALSDKQAGEVKITPLEWVAHNGDQHCKMAWTAETFGGNYCIEHRHEGHYDLWWPNKSAGERHDTLKSAQAFAQADYEQRIRSALVDVPAVEQGEWHRSDGTMGGTLLYTLREDGWRRGKPILVNDVTVRIERANGSKTDIEPIVRLIHAALAATRSGSTTSATERCRDCDGYNCDDGCAYPDASKPKDADHG